MLLESGKKQIVEHNNKDNYWGDGGGPGKGLNKFGELLMEVSKLRACTLPCRFTLLHVTSQILSIAFSHHQLRGNLVSEDESATTA